MLGKFLCDLAEEGFKLATFPANFPHSRDSIGRDRFARDCQHSQPFSSLGGFPAVGKPPTFRGLSERARAFGLQFSRFRSWIGNFWPPVSGCQFSISVSVYGRPVRFMTETGSRAA